LSYALFSLCLFRGFVFIKDTMENHGREEDAAAIPLIDLSPFFNHHADQRDRDRVIAAVGKACEEWGFFQVTNHGVPVDLIEEALDTCRVFFEYPAAEKMKVRGQVSVPQQMPTGYNVYPPGSWDLYENLYYRAGRSSPGQTSSDFSDGNAHCNAFPEDLPQLRCVIEKLLEFLGRATDMIESVISQALGLSEEYLRELNRGRVEPLKVLCYPKATSGEDIEIGAWQHQDSSCITLVGQDDTGGYQVLKDNKWVDIHPTRGALVINVGDILQVWSNNRLKSAVHRVLNNRERRRCSFAFASVPNPEKLVCPLPEFTSEVKRPAAYRSFVYKDYMVKRVRNKTHPPETAEDFADISIYAI